MIYALLAIGVVGVLVVGIYNSLIRLKNKVDEGWADIDTQLKRRYDLLPNLVETVKGYAKHEEGTFVKVTEARTAAMGAQNIQDKEAAENMLTGALKSIFALAENYPELKANTSFMELQKTLSEIEEHIQLSRRYYNATVRDFNTKLQVFPNNVIAGALGFKDRDFFQANDEEKKNVKVSFSEEKPVEPTKKEEPKEKEPKEEEPKEEEPKVEEPKEEEPKEEEPKEEEPKEEEPKEEEPKEEEPKEEEPKEEEPKEEEPKEEEPKEEEPKEEEPKEEEKPPQE